MDGLAITQWLKNMPAFGPETPAQSLGTSKFHSLSIVTIIKNSYFKSKQHIILNAFNFVIIQIYHVIQCHIHNISKSFNNVRFIHCNYIAKLLRINILFPFAIITIVWMNNQIIYLN